MHTVYMLCAAGNSTHLFAERVQEAADRAGYPVAVKACAIACAKDTCADADLLLLSPQVRFEEDMIKLMFPDTPVEAIGLETYASIDADAVLAQIKAALGA